MSKAYRVEFLVAFFACPFALERLKNFLVAVLRGASSVPRIIVVLNVHCTSLHCDIVRFLTKTQAFVSNGGDGLSTFQGIATGATASSTSRERRTSRNLSPRELLTEGIQRISLGSLYKKAESLPSCSKSRTRS